MGEKVTARGLRHRACGTTRTERALVHFVATRGRVRAGQWSVQSLAQAGAIQHRRSELRATRKPILLFELDGLLLRFATRQLLALLFQLPPRFTRFVPDDHRPDLFHRPLPHRRDPSAPQQLVQLLLRTSLAVGRNLDEFKWHRVFLISNFCFLFSIFSFPLYPKKSAPFSAFLFLLYLYRTELRTTRTPKAESESNGYQ